MRETPNGYAIRPPAGGDAEAIGAVLRSNDAHLAQVSTVDADFVRDQWASDGFDLSLDAWLVEAPGRGIAGYAAAFPDGPGRIKSWGVVHPEHLGRGIGSALLDLIETRAAQRFANVPDAVLDHAIDSLDGAADALVRARGFEHVRSFRHMRIELEGPVDPGEPPEGVAIRRLDPGRDLPEVHATLVEAFRGGWGYRVVPFEEWERNEARTPSADLGLWFVAVEGDRPVGALTATVWDDGGWIGEVGVLPAFRRRGIAAALLRRSFAAFAERGVQRVTLNVDTENPTDALRLYERVGMRGVRGWELFERRLG